MRYILLSGFLLLSLFSCKTESEETSEPIADYGSDPVSVLVENFVEPSKVSNLNGMKVSSLKEGSGLAFDVEFKEAGRYKVVVIGASKNGAVLWLEDYIDNKDGRTYNVTGDMIVVTSDQVSNSSKDGSPFNSGRHSMKLHLKSGDFQLSKIDFVLMRSHKASPRTVTQNMDGENLKLVWSDEFDGENIDHSKWTFDIGNWGWGNNELQYYTENRPENARIEDGVLVIEARKNDMDNPWTSTRMTTRGKIDFLYGKIEFRALVPREKGNWAAGWTLGDDYIDEKSWPYCGEIDILESVGFEVDNESGDGIAHATVHTPAYYFKIDNQISSQKAVKNIAGEFHTYSVIWTPTEVRGFVDGEEYYLYDKNANEKEWPFAKPQNIILNLAMGGGWGGEQGMDTTVTSQKFLVDYIRVYDMVDEVVEPEPVNNAEPIQSQ